MIFDLNQQNKKSFKTFIECPLTTIKMLTLKKDNTNQRHLCLKYDQISKPLNAVSVKHYMFAGKMINLEMFLLNASWYLLSNSYVSIFCLYNVKCKPCVKWKSTDNLLKCKSCSKYFNLLSNRCDGCFWRLVMLSYCLRYVLRVGSSGFGRKT